MSCEEDAGSIVSATTQNSDDTQIAILMVKPKEMKQEESNTDLVLEVDGQLPDFVSPVSPILPVYDENGTQGATNKGLPSNNGLCDGDEDVCSGDDCSQMSEVLIPLKQKGPNKEHNVLYDIRSAPNNKQEQDTETLEPSQSLLPLTTANKQILNKSKKEGDSHYSTSFSTPVHAAGTEAINVADKLTMKSLNEDNRQTKHHSMSLRDTEHLSTEGKHKELLHLSSNVNVEQHDLGRRKQATHIYRTRSLTQPSTKKYKKRKYNMYSDCSDSCCSVEKKKSKTLSTRTDLGSSRVSVKQTRRTSDSVGHFSSQVAVDGNCDEVNLRIGKLLNAIDKLPARQQEVVKTTVEHCIVKLQDNLETGLSLTLNASDQQSHFQLRKLIQVIQSNLTCVMLFYKRCEKDGSITHDQSCLFDMHVQHKKNLLSIVQRQKNLVKQFKAQDRDKSAAHVSNMTVHMKQQIGTKADIFNYTDEINARASFEENTAKDRKYMTKVTENFDNTVPVRTSVKSQITSGNYFSVESEDDRIDPGQSRQTTIWGGDNSQVQDRVGTKSELLWLNMLHGKEDKHKHGQTNKVHITTRDDIDPVGDRAATDGVYSQDVIDGQVNGADDDNISDNESIDILTATKVTHCTSSLHENLNTYTDRQISACNIPVDYHRTDDEENLLGDKNSSTNKVIVQDLFAKNNNRTRQRDRKRPSSNKDLSPTNDQYEGENAQLSSSRGTYNLNAENNSQNKQDHGHSPTRTSDSRWKISESEKILSQNTCTQYRPKWSLKINGDSQLKLNTLSTDWLEKPCTKPCQVTSPVHRNSTTTSDLRKGIGVYETDGNCVFNRKADSLPTWKELIAEKRIIPGQDVLSVQIKAIRSSASVTENGKIHDPRGLWFNSPAKWLSSLMGGQTIKKAKAYELVMYNGKTIQAICMAKNETLTAIRVPVDDATRLSGRRNSQRDQITQTEFLDAIDTDTRIFKEHKRHLNHVLSSSVIHLLTKKDFVPCEDLPDNFWSEDFAKVKLCKSVWNSVTCW